ncbi:tetratricopeptide repeat protein [Hypnocyclicus thermotrophus]|uniref:Tetratricopeptide repeat protein n=1 Tax=Hypnocyclicus thermotrophus TaxID=1627895 RepID=A0AA46DYT2_9FUSO|nr:tetratricopeptide repeat protein [Hypnocyclicus thermotrophus]TDT70544.1 tetratricopeptide repeat protein [Hypnocyclicus thermotrophus]
MLRTRIFKEICQNVDLEEKKANLKEKLKNDPNNLELLEKLAAVYYYQQEDFKAVEIYKKLVTLDPENAEYLAFLGYLCYELNELDLAIDYLNESLDIDSSAPFVFFILGNTYSRAGMIKQAVDAYDFAIFLDLDIYTAHMDFAKKYEDMGRKHNALKEYLAAYDIDSRDVKLKNKIKNLKEELNIV